ncbi:F0F1 ATP synthase subunit epsilon [Corynebacterium yudongzhengii]|uniref:ATP synthase epsilon chain n=1 Tax=Corynebacterium yudongzhengii TaxID=2080740 RepID=A0A2U1T9E2_9CORY|nr:F0F1 ATP synthase subunit epsilon [Corynebacterium yudongzhengii]AWB82098.1 F0F1 ATP synthase subunit epsilon [Corynebacterium yudongzhengii]PWC02602.1 F0F1 ATP synthase subunit epsilon [Corynebacterium yudongzhengii]
MAEFTVQMVSVDRMLWSGQATMVTAQTTEGEIGVLPGHEPLLGQLVSNGIVTIDPVDGDKLIAAVQDGFLTVTSDKVTVLAHNASWSSEIDEEASTRRLESEDAAEKARAESDLKALRRSRETR